MFVDGGVKGPNNGPPKNWKKGQEVQVNGTTGKIGTKPIRDPKHPWNIYFRADMPGGAQLRVDLPADGAPK